MSALRATTWRYATTSQSVCLTASASTQGYQLLMVGPAQHERLAFTTVDAVLAAQAECEALLLARGFLLVEFTCDGRTVAAAVGYPRRDDRRSAEPSIH